MEVLYSENFCFISEYVVIVLTVVIVLIVVIVLTSYCTDCSYYTDCSCFHLTYGCAYSYGVYKVPT